MIFENLLINIFEEKKNTQIKTENQFSIILIEKILILGSKDENKFIILIKMYYYLLNLIFFLWK